MSRDPANDPTYQEEPANVLPDTFTAEDLDMLSDEEQAAIKDDPDQADLQAKDDAAAAEAEKTGEAEAAENAASAEDDAAAQAAAAEAGKTGTPDPDPAPAQPQPAPNSAAEAKPEPVPQPKMPTFDVEGAKTTLETLKADQTKLMESYEDGEIGASEWQEKMTALTDQIADAQATIKAQDAIATSQEKSAETIWYETAEKYLDQFPELRNSTHIAGFDRAVRYVASTIPDLPVNDVFELAHRNYANMAQRAGSPLANLPGQGVPDPTPKPDPAPTDKAEAETAETKLPDPGKKPDLPPTLATVPGESQASVDDGRFAAIDRAIERDVFEGEAAMAKMSDDDLDAYLRSV